MAPIASVVTHLSKSQLVRDQLPYPEEYVETGQACVAINEEGRARNWDRCHARITCFPPAIGIEVPLAAWSPRLGKSLRDLTVHTLFVVKVE